MQLLLERFYYLLEGEEFMLGAFLDDLSCYDILNSERPSCLETPNWWPLGAGLARLADGFDAETVGWALLTFIAQV